MKTATIASLAVVGVLALGACGSTASTGNAPKASAPTVTQVTTDPKAAAAAKAAAAKAALAAASAKLAADAKIAAAMRDTVNGDGTRKVGTDINPGQWRTAGQSGCYYAVLSSPSDTDIVTNDNTDGPAYATLAAGQYFETQGCAPWSRVG